ncbi:MAG: hypothetical protein NT062_28280 [Proteobacteria bacterium]|nr:hypothetical protein [Pseudomonadota bacterium]
MINKGGDVEVGFIASSGDQNALPTWIVCTSATAIAASAIAPSTTSPTRSPISRPSRDRCRAKSLW